MLVVYFANISAEKQLLAKLFSLLFKGVYSQVRLVRANFKKIVALPFQSPVKGRFFKKLGFPSKEILTVEIIGNASLNSTIKIYLICSLKTKNLNFYFFLLYIVYRSFLQASTIIIGLIFSYLNLFHP